MTLDDIYAQIPEVGCKGLCHAACGPILFDRLEMDRLRAVLPVMPWAEKLTDPCPLLRDGRCGAYGARPLSCRLFGAVDPMPCPHGCKPAAGRLSQSESARLVHAVGELPGGGELVTMHREVDAALKGDLP